MFKELFTEAKIYFKASDFKVGDKVIIKDKLESGKKLPDQKAEVVKLSKNGLYVKKEGSPFNTFYDDQAGTLIIKEK